MHSQKSPDHEDIIATVTSVLAKKPSEDEVAASFRRTMETVTTTALDRIQEKPRHEEPIISPYLMQLHTKLSLVAGTLVVVLLVGYMTYNRPGAYVDLEEAALEAPAAYEEAAPQDEMSDLDEEFIESVEGEAETATAPAATGATAPAVSSSAVDVNTELAAFETLFASDDIDDSGLEAWVSDTSASDGLIESYDF
jgi:hypothetical protein